MVFQIEVLTRDATLKALIAEIIGDGNEHSRRI